MQLYPKIHDLRCKILKKCPGIVAGKRSLIQLHATITGGGGGGGDCMRCNTVLVVNYLGDTDKIIRPKYLKRRDFLSCFENSAGSSYYKTPTNNTS